MDVLRGSDFGPDDHETDFDDGIEAPPPVIGQDERRMQVRAYNYWAGLLGKRRFPAPDRLLAGDLPEFSSNSVLLHFSDGIDDPQVLAIGPSLAAEFGDQAPIGRLSQVPGRSVLSRITDHYLQIIANEAPIGFEAEFVNARGATILYRGILLPFSSDDTTIDYIYGAINWKELADPQTSHELMLEISQTLDDSPIAQRRSPSRRAASPANDDAWADDQAWADGPTTHWVDDPARSDSTEPFSLDEWLEKARASALRAQAGEDRTRQSLYAAIGRAWDFALAADAAPDDYARLIAQAGLVLQTRAPLIGLAKLVFGSDYDKTRLTEYATLLGHARRVGVGRGALAGVLAATPGGIKAIVAQERAARRSERRPTAPRQGWQATARALPGRPLAELAGDGAEFALIMVRRLPGQAPALLGEIAEDAGLLARAARQVMG